MKTITTDESKAAWIKTRGGALLHTFTTEFAINGMGISRDIYRLSDGTIAVYEAPFTAPASLRVGTVAEFQAFFGHDYDSELARA